MYRILPDEEGFFRQKQVSARVPVVLSMDVGRGFDILSLATWKWDGFIIMECTRGEGPYPPMGYFIPRLKRPQVFHYEDLMRGVPCLESLNGAIPTAPLDGDTIKPWFLGGYFVFVAYEAAYPLDPVFGAVDPPTHPLMLLYEADLVAAYDKTKGILHLINSRAMDNRGSLKGEYRDKVDELLKWADGLMDRKGSHGRILNSNKVKHPIPFIQRQEFENKVRYVRDAIWSGQCIQVVLSQKFLLEGDADPFLVYKRLRELNPSPYSLLAMTEEITAIGCSPEVHVRVMGDRIFVRPIAGTRPVSGKKDLDEAMALDLLQDPKESSEHVMLVDLARNDVGRLARPGSVRVNGYMLLERYSRVMHLVSQVEGVLRNGIGPMGVLRATFPAGTVSGAPKLKAMELIQKLETTPRSWYAGCFGLIGHSGYTDLAITIRTAFLEKEGFIVQTGAGIVAESQPHLEYLETIYKAKALFDAFGVELEGR